MSEIVLEVKNLVKDYGTFRAVDGISFVVPKGKVIGFLGPNGAGKTTTIQILLGITLATSATIRYFGKNFFDHREECLQRINFASSFNTLQGRITVFENLQVFGYLYQVPHPEKKIQELARYFEIEDLLKKKYWDLSSGQKTRVNIIKSLLNDPEMLLLDEPTASLDPDIADKLLSLIEQLRKERRISMLYTSHDMAEVSRVCDEVIFLDHGKIVAYDTPFGLTKRIRTAYLRITFDTDKRRPENYLKENELEYRIIEKHIIEIKTEEALIPKLIFGMSKDGVYMTDIEVKKPTLEDVFLQIARGDAYVV